MRAVRTHLGGHACAQMGDGTAKCWGHNNQGQLGDNSKITRFKPVDVRF